MQQPDYTTAPPPPPYYPNYSQNPNPAAPPPPPTPPSYASAPPFSNHPENYHPYPQSPDPLPTFPHYEAPPPYYPAYDHLNYHPAPAPAPAPIGPGYDQQVYHSAPAPAPAPVGQSSGPGYDQQVYHPALAPAPAPGSGYDQLNYHPAPVPGPAPVAPIGQNAGSGYGQYSASYNLTQPGYESVNELTAAFDRTLGGYGRSSSDLGPDFYGKRADFGTDLYGKRADSGFDMYGKRAESGFDMYGKKVDSGLDMYGKRADSGLDMYGKRSDAGAASNYDYGYGDGVYAYQGSGKVEPYGARGTGSKSSMWKEQVVFDDFGRPIGSHGKEQSGSSGPKIVKAVPKVDTQDDVKSGVQKFRVKLLAESGGQSTMDVLCQIGLDGIRMLDPSTSRTLRIYPLDTITRCEVIDSSIFAFWSKSSVDIDSRRIRLQSNRYTTNTLLDTVTAATVQLKEMGARSRPADSLKTNEQPAEKKKGLGDWMNMIKPANEEKDHWVPDEAVNKCTACGTDFNAFVRKHHCRNCGDIFCDKCTHGRIALTSEENAPQVRVCDRCMAEVTQRLTNAKEAASRSATVQSHEDLAKKLQEEMERNRKASSGSKSDGSSKRMKEVACPTCTVHLQVQVPSSGSETIECGVCQHPFLVSAH